MPKEKWLGVRGVRVRDVGCGEVRHEGVRVLDVER